MLMKLKKVFLLPLMQRHSCCYKQKVRKGLWSPEEDEKLMRHITKYGHGCWSSVPKQAGLQRCGKSCRLRWINYLRPDLKRSTFSLQEENLIIKLHAVLGNRWSQIATQLPGRTDNEIKNLWNSCIKKKLRQRGIGPNTFVAREELVKPSGTPATEEVTLKKEYETAAQTSGIVVKASYSTARISSESNGSVGQNSLLLGTETFRINKINGTCPSSSTRETRVLDAYEDEYEGLLINLKRLPLNTNAFTSALRTSLYHWRLKGKKGVWLKLPVERSELVPVAVKEGFEYHLVERDYVMITYWIPEGPSMLPSNASHQVGVGGFVINEKKRFLWCKRSTVP